MNNKIMRKVFYKVHSVNKTTMLNEDEPVKTKDYGWTTSNLRRITKEKIINIIPRKMTWDQWFDFSAELFKWLESNNKICFDFQKELGGDFKIGYIMASTVLREFEKTYKYNDSRDSLENGKYNQDNKTG